MNRRAFLLGAAALPAVAPVAALAATPATGGVVRGVSMMIVGEVGPEYVLPTSLYDATVRAIRSDHLALVDGGTFSGEVIWNLPSNATFAGDVPEPV